MRKHQATEALFSALKSAELRYAVLRNYDQYPDFGHDIDLILHQQDLPAFRTLITKLATEENWHQLTECHHWAKSASPHHRIEVFRCYLTESEYLQVDLFHAFLLWGLPLLNEHDLLANNMKDERGFTRIHHHHENMFRMLQIHRLTGINAHEKIQRYQQRIIDHAEAQGTAFTEALMQTFGIKAVQALQALKVNDHQAFIKCIADMKKAYLLNQLLQKPFYTIHHLWNRFVDLIQFNYLSPCGQTLPIQQSTGTESLFQALDTLKNCFAISQWAVYNQLTAKERQRILERGGIVVQLQRLSQPEIQKPEQKVGWIKTLIHQIEKRHYCHYQGSGEQP